MGLSGCGTERVQIKVVLDNHIGVAPSSTRFCCAFPQILTLKECIFPLNLTSLSPSFRSSSTSSRVRIIRICRDFVSCSCSSQRTRASSHIRGKLGLRKCAGTDFFLGFVNAVSASSLSTTRPSSGRCSFFSSSSTLNLAVRCSDSRRTNRG